jgi:putative SOS response-associated peptidase YedK
MCGRFVASRPVSELAELLDAAEVDPAPPERARVGDGGIPPPRWNVAPQAAVWALTVGKRRLTAAAGAGDAARADAGGGGTTPVRRLAQYRWGLVPSWAKDPSVGARMFNARGDTVAAKAAYRTALARRRCIIPADAFYEWGPPHFADGPPGAPATGGTGRPVGLPGIDAGAAPITAGGRRGRPRKQPWCFRPADGGILAFAGLWEAWKPRQGEDDPGWLLTCTIITTSANELVSEVHDRMPVILARDDEERWLGPGELGPDDLGRLLSPAPSGTLVSYKVADLVSNSNNEGPELAEAVADVAEQP